MKASDLFIKALENEGVEYIFGVPGEENLDFLESLRKSEKIKLITTRHEQSAGFMAATVGRLTGKAGVCLSTLGPGATNFMTAAAYAQLGGMPMMMITGQKPIKSSKQGLFQIVDVVGMMKPVTKFAKTIINGNLIPSLVREAFRTAEDERPGAVHLELPEDIAAEETSIPVFPKVKVRRPVPDEKSITEAIALIQSAKKPLVLIGAGANRKWASKWIIEFFKKTKIPFANSQMGKGITKDVFDLYLGTTALSDNDFVHLAIEKADLIINLGHDIIEKPPFFMKHGGTKVIHINFFPAQIDSVYFPQLEIVGDIGNTMWQLTENITPNPAWDFADFYTVRDAMRKSVSENIESNNFPLFPQRIVEDVRKALPDDGVVTLDNGMYKLWFARQYRCLGQNTLLLDNALATMGAGLPSAIATKLIFPERKVIAVAGDGGFMMNSQEVETAVRLQLDLVVIILNDSGYGMIKWKQSSSGFESFGLEYGNPDFVKYAQAYGAQGHRVESAESFLPLLTSCVNGKGVHIIEVPIEYSENIRLFTEELPKQVKALRGQMGL